VVQKLIDRHAPVILKSILIKLKNTLGAVRVVKENSIAEMSMVMIWYRSSPEGHVVQSNLFAATVAAQLHAYIADFGVMPVDYGDHLLFDFPRLTLDNQFFQSLLGSY
jgi:hypothetical protein